MVKWIVVAALAGLALVGGYFGSKSYYQSQSDQVETQLKQLEDWAKQQKPVKTKLVVSVPPETPRDQVLYLSGSMPPYSWEPGAIPLSRQADGTHVGEFEVMSGVEQQFKITRGTWGTVETTADDKEIDNRTYTPAAEGGVLKIAVAGWRDKGLGNPGKITLTGTIRQHKRLKSELLGNERNLTVYLPPGYDDAGNETRYPVLYVNDGNNIFNEADSFQNIEWKLDEAAQKLIVDGKIQPLIIVGIWNTEQRAAEYTPAQMSGKTPGQAADYAKFFREGIKAYIDGVYRTKPEPEFTAVGGGSLGALAAVAFVDESPAMFGKVALFSPHLSENDKPIDALIGGAASFKGKQIWMCMGGKPSAQNYAGKDAIADAKTFAGKLTAAGAKVELRTNPDADHNESAWQNDVEPMLMSLFGK